MINPSPNNTSNVQISCYANQQCTDKAIFSEEIEYRQIEHGSLASRSKENASAIVWSMSTRPNSKKNRIFCSIDDESIYKEFNTYMDHLIFDLKSADNTENGKLKSNSEKVESIDDASTSDESIENADGTNCSTAVDSDNIAEKSISAENSPDPTPTDVKPSSKQTGGQTTMAVAVHTMGRKKVENFFSFKTFADCYGCPANAKEPADKFASQLITPNTLKSATITTVTLSTSVKSKKDFLKSIKRSKIIKRIRHIIIKRTKQIISK